MTVASAASPDQVELYTQGMCHVFAVALHRAFGWSIHLVLDQAETWWEDSRDPDNRIPAVVHAYALDPAGNAWDILGSRPLGEAQEELSDWVHVREYDSETVHDEKGLAHWCGCWQDEDDGSEVDRPLSGYDETDVEEAISAAFGTLSGIDGFPSAPKHGSP